MELMEDGMDLEDNFRRKRNVNSSDIEISETSLEMSSLGELLYPNDYSSGNKKEYLKEISNIAQLLYPKDFVSNKLEDPEENQYDYSIDPLNPADKTNRGPFSQELEKNNKTEEAVEDVSVQVIFSFF